MTHARETWQAAAEHAPVSPDIAWLHVLGAPVPQAPAAAHLGSGDGTPVVPSGGSGQPEPTTRYVRIEQPRYVPPADPDAFAGSDRLVIALGVAICAVLIVLAVAFL